MANVITSQHSSKTERDALRVLDSLDRWDERLNGSYSKEREHNRNSFRGMAIIVLPPIEGAVGKLAEPQKVQVWLRNISQGGLSCIYPGKITHQHVVVGVGTDPARIAWFHSEIVRSREVPEQFWEYGIAFRSRADV